MDKSEYQEKLALLMQYIDEKDYDDALAIVNEVDWKRVKSVKSLNLAADVYEATGNYDDAKRIMVIALSRAQVGRSILRRLVEISLKLGEIRDAESYFEQYSQNAAHDDSRFVLQYLISRAKSEPLSNQIELLEEYRDREYTEKWAYELATLYAKVGDESKCAAACDDLILWFGEGRYVLKALELKNQYEPLSNTQKKLLIKERERLGASASTVDIPKEVVKPEKTPEQMKAALSESLQEVFQGVKKSPQKTQQEDALNTKLENTIPFDQFKISELEPEQADTSVYTSEKPAPVFVSRPQPKEEKAAEAKEETAKIWSDIGINKKDPEEVKMESLLKETAGAFSEEISSGKFEDESEEKDSSEHSAPDMQASAEDSETEVHAEDSAAEQSKEGKPSDLLTNLLHSVRRKHKNPESRPEFVLADPPEDSRELFDKDEAAQNAISRNEASTENGTSAENGASVVTGASSETGDSAAENASVEASKGEIPETETAAETETETSASEEAVKQPAPSLFRQSIQAALQIEGNLRGWNTSASTQGTDTGALSIQNAGDTIAVVPSTKLGADSASRKPKYNEELEIPDPEPTDREKLSHSRTLDLSKVGENTIPMSFDELVSSETPEERRIRFLSKNNQLKMNDKQRKIFTYFARIPGMDNQILGAMSAVYQHVDEKTSAHGNLAIMGEQGTGKSRLARNMVSAMCEDLNLEAAKIARISGYEMNHKEPVNVVNKMAGGFLIIEECGEMTEETVEKLSRAMDFRTDRMILIIEDEKSAMRTFLAKYPEFAKKIERVISIPIFTNDELITFARTYAEENNCSLDDMAVLALYTIIGNNQSYEEPMTISRVKELLDTAISNSRRGRRKRRGRRVKNSAPIVLQEKDFNAN